MRLGLVFAGWMCGTILGSVVLWLWPADAAAAPARKAASREVGVRPIAAAAAQGESTTASESVGALAAQRTEPEAEVALPVLRPHERFLAALGAGMAQAFPPFSRETLQRDFDVHDDGGTAPGAQVQFLDLDGDGREDAVVALGDGWWGRRFDLCHFVPGGTGFVLASHLRIEDVTRGAPPVRALPAHRPGYLKLLCHDGWGTGYQTTCMRVVERTVDRLVEVARVVHSGEIIHGGSGPVLEYGCTTASITPAAAAGASLLRCTYRIDFTTEGFGEAMATVDTELTAAWVQPRPGAPFELAHSEGFEAIEVDTFWCLGARAWLRHHAGAVRSLGRWTADQLVQLHRICDHAESKGPFSEAAAVRAVIPPEPPR